MPFRCISYLFFLCGIITLTSCKTTLVIPLRVYDPSEVNFPDGTNCVSLVKRIYYPTDNEGFDRRKKHRNDSLVKKNYVHNKIFEGISDVLIDSELIDTVIIVKMKKVVNDSLDFKVELESLGWDIIRNISDRNKSDILISLDGLNVDHSFSAKTAFGVGLDNNSLVYRVGKLNVCLSVLFRVYDPKNKHLIEKYLYSDTIFWESEGTTLSLARKSLPEIKDALSEAGYWSGFDYADRFIPKWEDVDRFYYVRGGADLIEAANLAKEEKWMDAAKIWKVLAYGPDKNKASRAALNMALVSEMNDNLEVALSWAKKSYSLDKKESVEQYIKVLLERIRIYKKYVWTEE